MTETAAPLVEGAVDEGLVVGMAQEPMEAAATDRVPTEQVKVAAVVQSRSRNPGSGTSCSGMPPSMRCTTLYIQRRRHRRNSIGPCHSSRRDAQRSLSRSSRRIGVALSLASCRGRGRPPNERDAGGAANTACGFVARARGGPHSGRFKCTSRPHTPQHTPTQGQPPQTHLLHARFSAALTSTSEGFSPFISCSTRSIGTDTR